MRSLLPVLLVASLIIVAGLAAYHHAAAMSNGAPQLNCIQCHVDAKNNPAEFTIEGLPQKVEPGKEYKITIKITKGPKSLGNAYGGFAVAVSAGQLIVTDKKNTFIAKTPTGTFITHTKAGSMKREWTFAWKAPSSCNGPITFEISVIAANGDGSFNGDAYGHKVIKVECAGGAGGAGGQAKPTTTTSTTVVTKTKTIVTETISTTTTKTSSAGLAVGVAILIFIVVVAGYLALAKH